MNDVAIVDLPDDPVLLKQVICERDAALRERDAALAQWERAIIGRQLQIEQMKRETAAALSQHQADLEQIKREAAEQLEVQEQRHKAELAAILRRFYGPRSEAFDATQLLLFGLAVAPGAPVDPTSEEAKAAEAQSGQKLSTRRINHHKHGRRELPANLPRVQVPHDLTEEQKKCPCCDQPRVCIGSEPSEQLEFVSASFKVLRHVRHKYACKSCGEGCRYCDGSPHIEIATKAAQPIEKGLPGPGLLAHIIVSKMQDHLPLYRLEQGFERIGVEISRSTMCAWMMNCGKLVQPLVDLMAKRIKQSKVIHTDDTRVPVQDEEVKGKCKSGRIWDFLGDQSNSYDIFYYTPDRTRAGPQNFLADYKGYLQAASGSSGTVRRDLHQGRRDRGRVHGPRAPKVLRRQGDRRPPLGPDAAFCAAPLRH